MEWSRIALLALLASCASAGSDDNSSDASTPNADSGFSFPDAARFPDATPMPDAKPASSVDAAPVGTADAGLFCDNSNQCGSTECCFSLGGPGFCVPGEEVIGVCLPD